MSPVLSALPKTDYFSPEFRLLLATATYELSRHVRHGERCVICGAIWPCERAVLTAFLLEAN